MTAELVRATLSLLVVLGLVAGLAWLLRRYGNAAIASRSGRRLAVVEALTLDARRRLVLIRRDQTEYLLLLGPQGDLVLPTNAAAPPSPSAAKPTADPQPPIAPSTKDRAT